MSRSSPRKPSNVSAILALGGVHRPDTNILKARFAERDARIAADNRSPVEIFLGDPPRDQSALTRRNVSNSINDLIASLAKRR